MVPIGGIMSDIPLTSLSQPTPIEPLDEFGGRALVEGWRASGLSGAAYCRANHLRPQRLHYWRERLGYPIKVVGERSPIVHPQPCAKRLETGTFAVPKPLMEAGAKDTVQVSPGEMAMVLEGISVHRATYHRHYHRPKNHAVSAAQV